MKMLTGWLMLWCLLTARDHYVSAAGKNVLVLGGNGFIGASTVVKLMEDGHRVTIVSRGNWYWDSKERVREKVDGFIKCDRKQITNEKCPELVNFVNESEHFDAVYDFSVQTRHDVVDTLELVKGKVGLYILVSTACVYDVCNKRHSDATAETDAVRPENQNDQHRLAMAHSQAHEKLAAEEVLMEQRFTDDGLPFVILRLPDVFGPRDTSYRFAIYHVWAKMTQHLPDQSVMLPHFLRDFKMSLVYSEDVAQMLAKLLDFGPQIRDQAINLGYAEPLTSRDFVEQIQHGLGHTPGEKVDYWPVDYSANFYLYPTVRLGPVDVAKARSLLDWEPTPFEEAVKATADFYEEVMSGEKFEHQRNEIIQIVGHQLYLDKLEQFWTALEKAYGINLNHFRPKEEL